MARLTGTCTGQYGNKYNLYLDYTLNSQSVANNRSNVTLRMWARSSSVTYGAYNLNPDYNYVLIETNDGLILWQQIPMDFRNRAVVELGTWRGNIDHDSEGKKTVVLNGEFGIGGASSLTGGSVGPYSWVLPTIPRASSIASFSIENNLKPGTANTVKLKITRASSSFTHDISLRDGTTTIASWNNQGTPTSLTVTAAQVNTLLNRMGSVTSKTLTLRVQTRSGSTNIGSAVTKTAKATVDASVVPSFDTITHSELESDVASKVGAYVQGRSRLGLAITGAAGGHGASVKGFAITFDGKTHNAQSATSDYLKGSGTLALFGKVTDTRGRTVEKSVSINVLPYQPPRITAFDVERCNADGSLNPLGTYVRVVREGAALSLEPDGDTEKNSLTYRIRYRERDTIVGPPEEWNLIKTHTPGLILEGVDIFSPYDILKSYDFQLEIADIFNTTISEAVLPTGEVPMAWDRHGIGIGKIREQGRLDVLGDIFSNGINITDSSIEMMGETIYGNYICWNNGLQVCWANLGTLVFDNFESYSDMWRTPLDALEFPYPKSFFERPVPGGGMSRPYNYGIDIQIGALNDKWRIRAMANKDRSGNSMGIIIVSAIGWWKEPGT